MRGIAAWFFSVLIAGFLIGLGAPFWFDVAKRLGALRKGDNPAKTKEVRNQGQDVSGATTREEIVKNVLDDLTP